MIAIKSKKVRGKTQKGRKGILFTLVTIILFLLMLSELIIYVVININYNSVSTSASVILNSGAFSQTVSAGFAAFLHDSLGRSLSALTRFESTPSLRGDYFVNSTALALASLMKNGTILGNTVMEGYMGNSTLSYFVNSIESQALQQNLELSITNSTLSIYQSSPFSINASYTALAIINSSQGTFTYPLNAKASVSLNGTTDLLSAEEANPTQIGASFDYPSATVAGGVTASEGSTSPFMFDYGTILLEPSGITCTSVPSQYRNLNYILATPSAINVNQSVCNMGGLVTYTPNSTTPLKPYLVYSSSSNLFNYLQNGTKLLLSGENLEMLNMSPLKQAFNSNLYFPSLASPSYLQSTGSKLTSSSNQGMFSLNSVNREAANFNGQSSSISFSDSKLPSGTQARTVSLWFETSSIPSSGSDVAMVFYGTAGTNNEAFDVGINSAGQAFVSQWGAQIHTTTSVSLNKWYNVVVVYNGTTYNVYLDNLGPASGTMATDTVNTGTAYIGSASPGNQRYFNGSIANIQIYNTALSASEIQQLHQEGMGGAPLSNAGLVGWWPLNGNTNDYSGNGNNGVPTAITYSNINGYVGNPLQYGAVYDPYNYSTVEGFGCNNFATCNSSKLYLPNVTISNSSVINVNYYAPITIQNTQTTATPAPFQQIITVNSLAYAPYEAGNLQNVEFFYPNGQVIPSWLESGNSNTSTSTVYWLKLANGIPASSTITVYIGFAPKSTNLLNKYITGEAPQLSPIYAEYDNGASVFLVYFNGDTPTSDFSTGGGDTVTQVTGVAMPNGNTGNALRFTTGSSEGATTVDMYTPVSLVNSPNYYVVEASVQSDGSGTDVDFGLAQNSGIATSDNAIFVGTQYGSAYFDQAYISDGSRTSDINTQSTTTTSWRYMSLTYNSSSSFYSYSAPQLYSTSGGYYGTVSTNPISSVSLLYWGFWGDIGAAGHWLQFDWVRARAYPPNGVMPTATVSSTVFSAPTSSGMPTFVSPPYPKSSYNTLGISGATLPNVARFNGQDSNVTVNTAIPLSSSQITVCAWINPTVITGTRREIVGNDNTASDSFFLSLNNNGNSEGDFWVHTGSGWFGPVITPSAVPTNSWSFLCGNWTGSNEYIYLNGKEVGGPVTTSNTISLPMGLPMTIGSDAGAQRWDGYIADVSIYNVSLSQQQIADLYLNNSVPGILPAAYYPLSGGLNGVLNVTPDTVSSASPGYLYGISAGVACSSSSVYDGACGANYAAP